MTCLGTCASHSDALFNLPESNLPPLNAVCDCCKPHDYEMKTVKMICGKQCFLARHVVAYLLDSFWNSKTDANLTYIHDDNFWLYFSGPNHTSSNNQGHVLRGHQIVSMQCVCLQPVCVIEKSFCLNPDDEARTKRY